MVDGYEEEAAERFSDETARQEAGQGLPDGAVREELFGARAPLAEKFAERLLTDGIQRGLIGPREGDRLWERHLYNSAVLSELLPEGATVVDVGSGAGLPGVPLAIARPDLRITLLEPMARRITWLEEIRDDLDLHVTVLRGRAEESEVRSRLHDVDCVVARAVGSLERLTAWCLPLVRPGGWLLAQKGASAEQELDRDRAAITRQGGERAVVRTCGESVLSSPARVVAIRRTESVDQGGASGVRGHGRGSARRPHKRRKRKER
ncbi:16S rRNA (guanine(527)-N(7))-methyltransferase RsmG [Actinopolyspora mortivallis]|uniref:Ribosomal RNA small subunit methyltransferase G n=1 Tax=Actinopolyspora mortivallis TaxID=33906 RepID=A0A2T0GWK9_ACTMO|nr:16S rRNA (guanine(527)-N(7))-methyltransferase RsmG [Actinopolyspora mortivallis]PRW63477.1 16S rRNA (guanine(527)-N(7))-methyltransferase RsmG [Actinopolyspora mortivallis]